MIMLMREAAGGARAGHHKHCDDAGRAPGAWQRHRLIDRHLRRVQHDGTFHVDTLR